MAWGTLLYAVLVAGSFQMLHPSRQTRTVERTRRNGVVSGLMSYGSSWVAIWAFTLAPIALVSALYETSTMFAVVIGIVFLKERPSLVRLASIATTLIGTTVLKLSR
jgi:drug/metabolite transporter (DMT)-like permease